MAKTSTAILLIISSCEGFGSVFGPVRNECLYRYASSSILFSAAEDAANNEISTPPPVVNNDITEDLIAANNRTNSSSLSAEAEAVKDVFSVHDLDSESMFDVLAGNVAQCLVMSDMKRKMGNDGASTGWTSWVEEKAAFWLEQTIDRIVVAQPQNLIDPTGSVELLEKRDEAQRWIRWMKNTPAPMMVEFSDELRSRVNITVDDLVLERIESTREDFLARIGCRVFLLPSGSELQHPLQTPAGAMAYGKLLYGGITRYRMLGGRAKRRAGERTTVYNKDLKSWLQYGGPERNFQAVDMGPAALVEVYILPKGLSMTDVNDENEMAIQQLQWKGADMFDWKENIIEDEKPKDIVYSVADTTISEEERNQAQEIETSFQSSVGGLRPQIEEIVRRVLDGRVIRPVSEVDESQSEGYMKRVREAEALRSLGLKPVKGLLLYGPPGCGKTALAREISKSLDARPPKIVAAPELLDRWVGSSEKLVRTLFEDAQTELIQCNGDPSKSALHVIVIDEIDAVFRKRSGAEDSGEVTRASVCNQLLVNLDGINALDNVLVIGMTNRRELLDEALLRPGRLEVQVKIPLPDQDGRREILQIHFEALRRKGRLSRPLCEAIDGRRQISDDDGSGGGGIWKKLSNAKTPMIGRKMKDLAADQWTKGFSGADLSGLVRCAGSLALSRARSDGGGVENLIITVEDVVEAVKEVKR